MAAPLISVIIPAYNHERFIGSAIESILAQSLDDFELIIIDDGSTDKTAEVIKSYDDSRISYAWQENQDAFNSINRGMGQASGKFISILNSDDVYTSDRLEKLVVFANDNQAACIFTDVIPISDEGKEFSDPSFGWNVWHQNNRSFYKQQGDLYAGFLHGNFMVTTSNLFIDTQAVTKVGKFSPIRYLHDYDYIFRMMLEFPNSVFYLDDQKLLYYRIHSGNTLTEAAVTGRQQDLEVIEKYMLVRVPESTQNYVKVGTQRLRKLENEIAEVKTELENNRQHKSDAPNVGMPGVLKWIKNKVCRIFCK